VLFALMLSVAGAYFFLKAQREKHKRLAKTAEQIQKSEDPKPGVPPGIAESPLAKDAAPKPAEKPKAPEAPLPEERKPEPPKAAEKLALPPTPAAPPASVPAPVSPEATNATQKKALLLSLKAKEDVWFRYQTDEDEVKDLTLRTGKVMMLRANKVFKIFSGNLGALVGTLNGQELNALSNTNKGTKSAVLPESEAANYKLPLFPQFQTKKPKAAADAEQKKATPEPPAEEKTPDAPATH
jgi:hypothetical protein